MISHNRCQPNVQQTLLPGRAWDSDSALIGLAGHPRRGMNSRSCSSTPSEIARARKPWPLNGRDRARAHRQIPDALFVRRGRREHDATGIR